MVNFRNLSGITDKAKEALDKRGGTEGLKQDASQLREIAKGQGSISDKAKAAAAHLKESGGERRPASPGASEASTSSATAGASATAAPPKPATETAPPKPAAKSPKASAGKAKRDATAKTGAGTTKGAGAKKPPAEEVGGSK
jgi:hypothetical protein